MTANKSETAKNIEIHFHEKIIETTVKKVKFLLENMLMLKSDKVI